MKHFTESVDAKLSKKGKLWRVVVATPGQGSSGKYSPEVLSTFAEQAFPAGTRAFFNHNKPEDRDLRDMVGTYKKVFWNDEEQVVEGHLEVFPHWAEFIEALGDTVKVSIYSAGEKDEDNNVTELTYHKTNSIDLIPYEGLEGSGLRERILELAESAREQTADKPSTNAVQENGRKQMEKEILDALKGLTDKLTPVVDFVNSSKTEAVESAQVEADKLAAQAAAEAAVEAYDASVAIIDAKREELTASQIETARTAAKAGEDVTSMVESFVKSNTELKTMLTESHTPVGGRSAGAAATEDYGIGWRR